MAATFRLYRYENIVATSEKSINKGAWGRGRNFDKSKILTQDRTFEFISVADWTLTFELTHLKNKLEKRGHNKLLEIENIIAPEIQPIFIRTKFYIASWEKI